MEVKENLDVIIQISTTDARSPIVRYIDWVILHFYIPTSLPQEQAAKTDMLSEVSIHYGASELIA